MQSACVRGLGWRFGRLTRTAHAYCYHPPLYIYLQRFTAEDVVQFKERGNKFNHASYLQQYDDTAPDKDKDPKGFNRFLQNKYNGRWSGRAGTAPVESIIGRNKPSLIVQVRWQLATPHTHTYVHGSFSVLALPSTFLARSRVRSLSSGFRVPPCCSLRSTP
jgi:hypothetical protein